MLIYKTTNLINGLIYIGQKPSMNTEEEFFNSNYYGSGKKIINAIKEFGKYNFKREIIDNSNDLIELDKKEEYWIEYYNATNPDIGYNISKNVGPNYFTGCHHTNESKEKISRKLNGREKSDEECKRISEGKKGKKSSDETRKILSESHKGKKDSIETRIKKSNKLKGNKYLLGHKQSPETIEKRRLKQIGRKNSPETIEKMKENRKENKTYIIKTPDNNIIHIVSRESVLTTLQCPRSIFNKNGWQGYTIIGKINNKQ